MTHKNGVIFSKSFILCEIFEIFIFSELFLNALITRFVYASGGKSKNYPKHNKAEENAEISRRNDPQRVATVDEAY